jgi:tRNA pseudouridine55 synthase
MNGVLAINKPQGMTSFDVVKKISKALHVKAGHTGTLDPMATGVLLVCVNQSTKLVPYLMSSIKTYEATMTFGIQTDSLDITGEVTASQPIVPVDLAAAKKACEEVVGIQNQQVPKVSAVRVNGKRLYKTKEEVELPTREITVYACEALETTDTSMSYVATVSKGTYIRVLTQTIAEKLSNIATTSVLTRTLNNHVKIEECQSIEDAIKNPKWLDYKRLLKDYVIIELEDPTFVVHGKTCTLDIEEDRVCFFYEQQPYAMYKRIEGNVFKSERGLF